jgi:very-short-patch-repair endonuclease
MTKPERILWKLLRELPPELEITFRRQHPVHPYILDFACIKLKLAIELDGFSHNNPDAQQRDQKRDAFLYNKGYTVLRFTNDELLTNSESIVATILNVSAEIKQAAQKTLPPWGEGWVGAGKE